MLNEKVVNTILSQLGGQGKLQAMLGAFYFVADGCELTFKYKMKGKMGNCIQVSLSPDDTYTMKFWQIRGSKANLLKELSGLMAEQLRSSFTMNTGLDLSL